MKKLFTFLSLSLSLAKADYWTQKADYPGACIYNYSFSFAIGNKGYIGCGLDSVPYIRKDFWEWDQVTNTWTQKADFGGVARYYAVAFAVSGKGYAGLGHDTVSPNFTLTDFWEYDPIINNWLPKASFPGSSRTSLSVTFVLDNKGFICTGGTNFFYNELWQYNPVSDSWSQKTTFPGQTRVSAFSFSLGNKAYLGSGLVLATPPYLQDFWEYDFVTNAWTQKSNVPGAARTGASAFSIGSYGFVGLGDSSLAGGLNDWWSYDPSLNQWFQKISFPGYSRHHTNSFSIGNKGYICKGYSPSPQASFQELWEYGTDSTTNMEEISSYSLQFTISPNPAKEFIVISYQSLVKEKINLTITDVNGKIILQTQSSIINHQSSISLNGFSKGIYFVEVSDASIPDRQGKEKAVMKFVKE